MFAGTGHAALESPGCAEDGSMDEMDTSSGVFEVKHWCPGEEKETEVFSNGEFLPFAIDTTQHSYYAMCDRDKLGVRYRGNANHQSDWGTVRANHPLPRRRRMFYFEATIASQGEQGCITIGLASGSFPMNKQPGTEPGSYGLEGSNGYAFNGSSRGQSFGTPLSTGDTVGLGVNFKKMEAFLTHNGHLIGAAFPGIRSALDAAVLYPCVGLHSQGEAVRLNFGQRPYLFDLSASMADEDAKELAAVSSVPVCPSLLRSLVRDYLLHQGCEKTLRSLGEADGEGEAWAKGSSSSGGTGTSPHPPPPPPPPPPAARNGCAHKESSNGASGDSASGSPRTEMPRPSQQQPGSGLGGSASGPWVSTVLAWGVSGGTGEGGRQGQGTGASGNRGSMDMDVEEVSGAGRRVGRQNASLGRTRQHELLLPAEDEEGGGQEGGGEEKQAEGGNEGTNAGRGRGASGALGFQSVAAGDLLRQLQLQLGGQGAGMFGGSGGGGDGGGSGGGGGDAGSVGGGGLFMLQGAGSGAQAGDNVELRGEAVEEDEEEEEDILEEDDDDEEEEEGVSDLEEEEEEEEEDDEEEEEEEEEEEHIEAGAGMGGAVNDDDDEDDDDEDDDDEEVDPEDDGFADVIIPWIQQEPFREIVRRVPVAELLTDGGGSPTRAAALTATLSFRTRLRRNILSGRIEQATELLQAERPGLLETRADVRFALKCQAFIELVKKGEPTAAVALAQRDLCPFRDSTRVRFDPSSCSQGGGSGARGGSGLSRGHNPTAAARTNGYKGHAEGGGTPTGSGTGFGSSRSAPTDSAASGVGTGDEDRAGSGQAGSGGVGSRVKGARASNYGSDSEEDGTERRTRKRRTPSYDRVRASQDGGHELEVDGSFGSDRALGSGTTHSASRHGFFPSALYGAPSVYDSKLIAVMGLLAYKDPADSPLGYLVSGLQNQAIADKVNDAVLAADAMPRRGAAEMLPSALTATHAQTPTSGLELAVRHLRATRQVSREAAGDGGQAGVPPHLHF